MYGIVVPPETEPYVTAQRLDLLLTFLPANTRRRHITRLVVLDPPCAVCDEEVPGWWEIEADGDMTDAPLHDWCRANYGDEQNAGLYV